MGFIVMIISILLIDKPAANFFLILVSMLYDLYCCYSGGGRTLSLSNISVSHSGVYTCIADNGVGNPVTDNISVSVLCEYL